MKKEDKSNRILLIILTLFIINALLFISNTPYEKTFTGFSIQSLTQTYQSTPQSSKVIFFSENLLLVFALFLTKSKHAQAAMEFLMTYGWAILAAIIAIGVLAYFGVFSPGQFTPSATVVSAPLYANAWNVQTGYGVNVELKNNGGNTLAITDISLANIKVSGQDLGCGISSIQLPGECSNLDPGENCIATVDCNTFNSGLQIGMTFNADISILYTKEGGTLELSSTGTIADKIIEGGSVESAEG